MAGPLRARRLGAAAGRRRCWWSVDTLAESDTGGGDSDPIGPRTVALVLGAALLLLAVLLTVDILRGGRGEAEAGEDVDLGTPMDLRTVGMLAGVLVATAALIPLVGWPIAGTVLFAGATYALGSRTFARDLPIAASGVAGDLARVRRAARRATCRAAR